MSTNLIPGQAEGNELGGSTSSTGSSSDPWMKLAQDAFKRSTTYADNNYRKGWEDGLRLFSSRHPKESKYNSEAYKFRSQIFRPKTRSVIRKHEATAALALFSNPDVLNLQPIDTDNQQQAISSNICKELLQYRLTNPKKGIPWFITSIGAFQDAMTVGLCASFQYWDYETRPKMVTKQAEIMPGVVIPLQIEEEVPVVDKPCCELISIQRLHFDPAAKWDDVVGTSPYIILEMPMYLQDVLDKMETSSKGGEPWKKLDEKTLLRARATDNDPVQQARDNKRENPDTVTSSVSDFDIIQVHLNFIKSGGELYAFYSLKDLELLTEPKPLEELFPIGEIPLTVGFCILETHQAMPKGLAQLSGQLQQEANEIANQRLDNVKFVLNKRWIVRRGSQVDVEGILRNVPGGVTMASDVEKDVREVNWTDVTASSFQEQDRLNADFDDLSGGGLNSSSVMTNRRMNETVGGMKMMNQGANMLTEYTFRVWVETWMEPTLRQLIKLEQKYESDDVVLAIAAKRAGAWEHYQQNPDLDKLLDQELVLTVNVGMGATDPEARFQRFLQASGAYAQIVAQAPPDLNLPEVRKELFGLAGFKDSLRFFNPQVDVRFEQAKQMLQQAEAVAQKTVDSHKDRIQRRERALDEKEHSLALQQMENAQTGAAEMQKAMMDFKLQAQDALFKQGIASQEARQDMQHKGERHAQDLRMKEQKAALDNALKTLSAKLDAAVKQFTARNDAAIAAKKAAAQPPAAN